MGTDKKIIVGYFAFSPQIAFSLCLALDYLVSIKDLWGFAWAICLFVMPLSVFFAVIPLYRPKDAQIATIASILGGNGHAIFYSGIYLELNSIIKQENFIWILMFSLIASGTALLLTWDNEKTAEKGNKDIK